MPHVCSKAFTSFEIVTAVLSYTVSMPVDSNRIIGNGNGLFCLSVNPRNGNNVVRNRLSRSKAAEGENDGIRVDGRIVHVAEHLGELQRVHLPSRHGSRYSSPAQRTPTESAAVHGNDRGDALVKDLHERRVVLGGLHLLLVKQLHYRSFQPSATTHQTGKTLVCSGNTDVGVDLDQLILGCVNIDLRVYTPS